MICDSEPNHAPTPRSRNWAQTKIPMNVPRIPTIIDANANPDSAAVEVKRAGGGGGCHAGEGNGCRSAGLTQPPGEFGSGDRQVGCSTLDGAYGDRGLPADSRLFIASVNKNSAVVGTESNPDLGVLLVTLRTVFHQLSIRRSTTFGLLDEFELTKEVRNFNRRVFIGVGPMNGVFAECSPGTAFSTSHHLP